MWEVPGVPHASYIIVPGFFPSPVPTVGAGPPGCPLHRDAPALPGQDPLVS